jgi:phosphoribosyl 1,2-cyclic phosphodiesterase
MKVRFWGVRGSIPVPGGAMAGYGGNTSCVEVTLSDGSQLILDAGTGIRELGLSQGDCPGSTHILLTHLHLDHIQGLMFFAPLFQSGHTTVIWGPWALDGPLRSRLGRYMSAPLSPLEIRELPGSVSFETCPTGEWEIGPAHVAARRVNHRGPTFGYRITDGDKTLCYLPDHEPALGQSLLDAHPDWVSGLVLAQGASLLIHDCQYTDDEYPEHLGWGHSRLTDTLRFARRSGAERTLLFHHDPRHDDRALDALRELALDRWNDAGGESGTVEMAREGEEVEL